MNKLRSRKLNQKEKELRKSMEKAYGSETGDWTAENKFSYLKYNRGNIDHFVHKGNGVDRRSLYA